MKNRSELREEIMKIIYQTKIYDEANISYDIDDLIKEQIEVENSFVSECVHGIIDNNDKLVELANKYLNDWTLDRLSKVDQSIILLGIYELL